MNQCSQLWDIQRANLYRIARVLTDESPYLYRLKSLSNELLDGYFYGAELTIATIDHLEVKSILKAKALNSISII